MERLGWQPGARDGWFQSYPLRQRALDAAGCKAVATGGGDRVDLAFASDYCFSPLEIDDLEVDADKIRRVMRATFQMLTELQGDPLERAK